MSLPTSAPSDAWIYLASQSPRRAQLLDQLGVAHRPLLATPDEDAEALEDVLQAEEPAAYVQRVTGLKLQAAMARRARLGLPEAPILCADTTVAIDSRILGKPGDAQQARAMLQCLSGRTHEVLTAVALAAGSRVAQALSRSQVEWRELSAQEIADYVASGEPMGKAGAYAIQSRAAAWTRCIHGSYTGIMGLPLFDTDALLREIGFFVGTLTPRTV